MTPRPQPHGTIAATNYILRTARGCNVLIFDDLARARAEKARLETRSKARFAIVKATTIEEVLQ